MLYSFDSTLHIVQLALDTSEGGKDFLLNGHCAWRVGHAFALRRIIRDTWLTWSAARRPPWVSFSERASPDLWLRSRCAQRPGVHFLALAATCVWYHRGTQRAAKLIIGPTERFYELSQVGLRNAPSGLGVYVLYTANNIAVYVGADADIYTRLARHLHESDPCIGQNSPTKFQWTPVNPSLLEATKKKWIDALNPRCK